MSSVIINHVMNHKNYEEKMLSIQEFQKLTMGDNTISNVFKFTVKISVRQTYCGLVPCVGFDRVFLISL